MLHQGWPFTTVSDTSLLSSRFHDLISKSPLASALFCCWDLHDPVTIIPALFLLSITIITCLGVDVRLSQLYHYEQLARSCTGSHAPWHRPPSITAHRRQLPLNSHGRGEPLLTHLSSVKAPTATAKVYMPPQKKGVFIF